MNEEIKSILETISNLESNIGTIGEWAIITKKDGMIHLDFTCNPTEEYDTIESYDENGWWFPLDKLTEQNFWDVWGEWNGHMSGGIYLYDDESFSMWDDKLESFAELNFSDLVNVEDGQYCIRV